jgi:hypothetical protein
MNERPAFKRLDHVMSGISKVLEAGDIFTLREAITG